MPTQEDIERQQELLAAHRRTLHTLLAQRATHTRASEPPAVSAGISEARAEIARIKAYLREYGGVAENLPEDVERPSEGMALRRGWPLALVGAAALLIVIIALVLRLLPGITIWGNGNITNVGPGSITINQGDSPAVRQQKLDQAKQLLIDDVISNLQTLDARVQLADSALQPIADPLAIARQTVAPLGGMPAAAFYKQAIASQAAAIRSKWANQPIRVAVDAPLLQVLLESGVESSDVRTFYGQMAEAQDAGDALLTTLDSAGRNVPDQASVDYWTQRIAVDHDILRNNALGAYAIGLQVLTELGTPPTLIASSLGNLASFAPPPPLSDTAIAALRAKIDAQTNALDQRRLALLATANALLDHEVATYTALNSQLVIADGDSANIVGVKVSKLRRLGLTKEALAGLDRYAQLMAADPTTAQYVHTAQSLAQQPDLNLRGGVYIFAVKADSAAAQAGIQVGDVVVSYDGSNLALPDDLKLATELTPAAKPVAVEWLRLDSSGHWVMLHASLPSGQLGAGLMAI